MSSTFPYHPNHQKTGSQPSVQSCWHPLRSRLLERLRHSIYRCFHREQSALFLVSVIQSLSHLHSRSASEQYSGLLCFSLSLCPHDQGTSLRISLLRNATFSFLFISRGYLENFNFPFLINAIRLQMFCYRVL